MLNQLAPIFYLRLRERRRMSQAEFGSTIGKSRDTVSNWERGQTRPSYDDEVRVFESCGCSWQETLEILSEVLSAASGRPVVLGFEDQGRLDHPKHPLTRAELRLREGGARLPEKVCQLLERQLLKRRTRAALVERDNADALEAVELWLDVLAGNGNGEAGAAATTTNQEEDPKRWKLFGKR